MALFKNTAQLKPFFPARLTMDFDDLKPTMDQVEQEYLAEQVLGPQLYTWLHDGFQNDDLDEDGEELLALCRPVAAHLAMYHYTGIGNVEMTSGGLAVGKTDTQAPASEWRTDRFERSTLRQGYRAMDVLINWLIKHADEWDEWRDSELYADIAAGYLRTTQQYNHVVGIGNSGWLFRQLLPAVRRAEQGAVASTLCSTTLATRLQDGITAGDLSATEKYLVKLCQHAAAHMAMADSIVELSLGIDHQGVWTFGALIGGQTSGGPTAAKDERMQARQDQARNHAMAYLEQLRTELQRQAEADPVHPYRASTCYRDPEAPDTTGPDTELPVGNFL